jgi:hypothetical protein
MGEDTRLTTPVQRKELPGNIRGRDNSSAAEFLAGIFLALTVFTCPFSIALPAAIAEEPPPSATGAIIPFGQTGVIQAGLDGVSVIIPDGDGALHSYHLQQPGSVPSPIPAATPARSQPVEMPAAQATTVVCECRCPPCPTEIQSEAPVGAPEQPNPENQAAGK